MSKLKSKLKYSSYFLIWVFSIMLILSGFSICVFATEVPAKSDRVIVSLGDSYSSGEGIEPFYGQDEKDLSKKINNFDWLAHRSQNAWSGMLTLPGVEGTMAENRGTHWYFAAVSGATTADIITSEAYLNLFGTSTANVDASEYYLSLSNKEQERHKLITKKYYKVSSDYLTASPLVPKVWSGEKVVSFQLDIFEELRKEGKEADYVTLTIGGNDVGFSDIVMKMAISTGYFDISGLYKKIEAVKEEIDKGGEVYGDICDAYHRIENAAGKQAKIIVAGYPQLFDENGSEVFITEYEVELVNSAVRVFNNAIESMVNDCRENGMDIYFVSVEDEFQGHGAYAGNSYINPIILGAQNEDINELGRSSAYSIHPNYEGAKAYKECVQEQIDILEGIKAVYPTKFNLLTYGNDGNLYDDYKIIIEGKKNVPAIWGTSKEENYYQEIFVDKAEAVSINLSQGNYDVIVTDGKSSYSKSIKVEMESLTEKLFNNRTEREDKELIFNTSFGVNNQQESLKTSSDERDIVLVLDVSGSMSGTPMEETKKASEKFIDTILENDASIGVVAYDNSAGRLSDFSTNKIALKDTILNLVDGGGTNIEDGLREAESMLTSSSAKKRIIVLMSDGEPNDGKQGDELIEYANQIKEEGILIYTIGFFESLGNKSSAQLLMEKMASDGCHYEVANASELVFFFEDMADQINGQKYIYVRIACPVDVSVTYQGQTLCSAEDKLNLRTDFGTLIFEENEETSSNGADNRVKVLRLKEEDDYDVKIEGTGHGIMNYTIGFMDEDGNYNDFRKFENIRITKKTEIDTVAGVAAESVLNIDEDGDGKYDLKLRAEENGYGEEVKIAEWVYYAVIGAGTLIVIDIIIVIMLKKKRKNKVR